MVGTLIFGLQRALLLLAITVALAATGLAHRLQMPEDQVLAFVLANGASPADICGDEAAGKVKGGMPCFACQITGSADLVPVHGLLIDVELVFAATVIEPRESRALARVLDLANTSQGPPLA